MQNTQPGSLIRGLGVKNLREIGGYQASDGRVVRRGLIYRGAATGGLSDRHKERLRTLDLKTLFDLRSAPEVAEAPDYVPPDCEYINISGIQNMDGMLAEAAEGDLDMKSMLQRADGDPEMIALLEGYLAAGYRQMIREPVAYIALFRALLDKPNQPLLFHCTAGKDRTGVGAALILLALGVPQATVLADYLLSNRYRAAEIRLTMLGVHLLVRDRRLKNAVRDLMGVNADFLLGALDEMKSLYGGLDGFLRDGLHLTPSDMNQLRANYLV